MNKLVLVVLILLSSMNLKSQNRFNYESKDTLYAHYTFWWLLHGPFAHKPQMYFIGELTHLREEIDTNSLARGREGTIRIKEVLHVVDTERQKYRGQKYFNVDCFPEKPMKIGQKFLVTVNEYEDNYVMPGGQSLLKIDSYEDPKVESLRKYVAADFNPNAILSDTATWNAAKLQFGLKYQLDRFNNEY
ncbi:MAG: hypothetical protein MRY83_07360 [Flavobacteriales bacterium]|nr:hypothetical protein [Flavobacteriales bacterium]